jgi:hypothetical protein
LTTEEYPQNKTKPTKIGRTKKRSRAAATKEGGREREQQK